MILRCRICSVELDSSHRIGDQIYCSCGWYGPIDHEARALRRRRLRWWGRGALVVSVLLSATLYYQFLRWGEFTSNYLLARSKIWLCLAGEKDWRELGLMCRAKGRSVCAEEAYSHLAAQDLDPADLAYLAIAQSHLKKHASAVANFERAHASGKANSDSMAIYARSLAALGREREAVKWYYKALDVKPGHTQAADELIELLAKQKHYDEALSLLGNLSFYVPDLYEYMRGRVAVLSELAQNQGEGANRDVARRIRLASVRKHHFLPLRFFPKDESQMFMVDTGATTLVFNSSRLAMGEVGPYRVLGQLTMGTADGRTLWGQRILIRRVYIGPWTLENVEAVVCDRCVALAGKSLLQRFRVKTDWEGHVEFLTLSRR